MRELILRLNAIIKCANLKKTIIFEQSRSFKEGKWRERQENGEIV